MTEERRAGWFPALEGYRGVAAVVVIAYHVMGVRQAEWGAWGHYTALLGRAGVSLFFVISGFSLYRPFVVNRLRGIEGPSTFRYAIRRTLRVVPAYLAVAIVALFAFKMTADLDAGTITTHLLLLQPYAGSVEVFQGVSVAWTVSVAIAFYLLLPLIDKVASIVSAGVIGGRHHHHRIRSTVRVEIVIIVLLVVIANLFRAHLAPDLASGTISGRDGRPYWLTFFLDWYAAGMFVAVVSAWGEVTGGRSVLHRLADRTWLCWFLAAEIMVLMGSVIRIPALFGTPMTARQLLAIHPLFGLMATALLLPAALAPEGGGLGRRALASRPLVALGTISYGLFLWHLLWLHQYRVWFGVSTSAMSFWVTLVVVLALSAASATTTYVLIERPLRVYPRPKRAPEPPEAPETSTPEPSTPETSAPELGPPAPPITSEEPVSTVPASSDS